MSEDLKSRVVRVDTKARGVEKEFKGSKVATTPLKKISKTGL